MTAVLFAANGRMVIQDGFGYTPTPVISHAILTYNLKKFRSADGVVVTPSHNPPEDGGFITLLKVDQLIQKRRR